MNMRKIATAVMISLAAATLAGPALAGDHDHGRHRGWDKHGRGWDDDRPRVVYAPNYIYAPPRVVYAPPPRVVYAPPPVYYAPPVVYEPSSPSISFVFPLR